MCGIAGVFQKGGFAPGPAQAVAARMADAVRHRGPDGDGVWLDGEAGISLAHRRLAIIDLSQAGHQPMLSHSGRYVITFNGEIYNHPSLRQELGRQSPSPIPWQGGSDTETLLACIDHMGLEETLRRITGMFAFALWDRRDRVLHFVRDRLGEKPLYYGWQNQVFLFGSELSAIKTHPDFEGKISRDALALFLRFNYIPAPWSIYQGIWKLPPGTCLRLPFGALTRAHPLPEPHVFWSVESTAQAVTPKHISGNGEELVDMLHELLFQAVGRQMVADVPIGALLSGGIDSSTVAALMQAQSGRPVRTFTIAFHQADYDETAHAKAIAKHLGTDHTELHASARDVLDLVPRLPDLYIEPFADAGQIPTLMVARLAREHVTVALSGDGGDELFGGYERYRQIRRLGRILSTVPAPLRSMVASLLRTVSPDRWDRLLEGILSLSPGRVAFVHPGSRLHKLADILRHEPCNPAALHHSLMSAWKEPSAIVREGTEPSTILSEPPNWINDLDIERSIMLLDILTYLPDDILAKVDRAAMSVSLETRMPLMDHQIVEFSQSLPTSVKIRHGQGKWILRQVCHRYIPKQLTERPKMGITAPVRTWLRGDLKDWAEAQLAHERLSKEGFFDPQPVLKKWAEHLSGTHDWSVHLWSVLMFQSWLERSSSHDTPSTEISTQSAQYS